MNKYRFVGLTSVAVLVTVVVLAYATPLGSILGNLGTGSGSAGEYLSDSQLSEINTTNSGVAVSTTGNVVYVNSSTTLPVLLGPMYSKSMYSFEILGKISPDIIVKNGSMVKFIVVNIDDDSSHNFVISTQGPPYQYMGSGMMNGQNGSNYGFGNMMDGYYQNNNSYGYMMGYLPPESSGHYAFVNVSYDFTDSGTFWYLCTYPGHASNGMYGKIVVD